MSQPPCWTMAERFARPFFWRAFPSGHSERHGKTGFDTSDKTDIEHQKGMSGHWPKAVTTKQQESSMHDKASGAALLAQGAQDFPMPERELARVAQRRWILRFARQGGTGAEIGVFRGHFSEVICETLAPSQLYLVDPWTKVGPTFGWGKAYTSFGTLPTALAREETRARVAPFDNVATTLLEDFFPDCLQDMPDRLDFAYLDASHQYVRTLAELHALASHMAMGGIIMGDDWQPDPDHPHHGVFQAVQHFTQSSRWQIIAAGPAGQWALRCHDC